MISLDLSLLGEPFGVQNEGRSCWLNALLQALAGCSSIHSTLSRFLQRTELEQHISNFILNADRGAPQKILKWLQLENGFGYQQESVSEGLLVLLAALDAPLTSLFMYRQAASVRCTSCNILTSQSITGSQFELFFIHPSGDQFNQLLTHHYTPLKGYICPKCQCHDSQARRGYRLKMISEIIVCIFNIYDQRPARWYPQILTFQGVDGVLEYKQVAQIEHTGDLHSGHYCARALRADGRVYYFNDTTVTLSTFAPTPDVYMVFYHYTTPQTGISSSGHHS